MVVLSDKTLKDHFNELDFFPDKNIFIKSFKPTDSEINARITQNQELYRRIGDIMNLDDDSDKYKSLEKFLDEKLSKRIVSSVDWKSIDIQDILNSIERKAVTANLELIDVDLSSAGLMTSLVYNTKGTWKKKSTNFVIVCDTSGAQEVIVKATFNKEIKKMDSPFCKVNGQEVSFIVGDKLIRQSIGINDNHHDFYIIKVACENSFFKEIQRYFSINKKEEIIVIVPEEADYLSFGNGDNVLSIPLDGEIKWTNNAKLIVPVVSDDDSDQINFTVTFENKTIGIILKLNTAKSIPPIGPEAFPPKEKPYHGVPTDNGAFGKITDGETERGVFGYWRQYLEWERLFIENNCQYIEHVYNDVTEKVEPNFVSLNIPEKVSSSLEKIFNYYKTNNTTPSLCPLTDDIKTLYIEYWSSVKSIIESIPNTRPLSKEEYSLTKLGVVSFREKIFLSPFHPINIAFRLEYESQYDEREDTSFARKLLTPFYLLPYLYFNDVAMRPYTDSQLSEIKHWLGYEIVNNKPQERTNDITTKMVWSKMEAFIRHFDFLFQDKECPIIISTIGITDDTNVVKGVIEFIKRQFVNGVQRIELHEYVENIMEETFFEKLNRLDSVDSITRELQSVKVSIDSKGEYTNQDIIHQLFTRVSFYKHSLPASNDNISYCHIAFYQMDTGTSFIKPNTDDSRTELAFNGLISIPSTESKDDVYVIGFGTKGQKGCSGYIFPMAVALNNLYANEENEGSSVYHDHTCVSKRFKFVKSKLLNSIYDNANWVTFINPEVDINFFYKQNLYIVHYTDQYSINAKYDSITVTKHVDQYENMLKKSYEHYALTDERFAHFNRTMMNYFNCLNGSWMLEIVNKTEAQIKEKMSIVAASIAMLRFMSRNNNVHWIPISLEEILRVTGSIGLPQEYIFTKKTLGAKGAMSDDLLMMGLDYTDESNLRLYLYPVEVKFSKSNSFSEKGSKQVCQTYTQLHEHLVGEAHFTKNIYRTFFASQFLTNAEKLNANELLSNDVYKGICRFRHELLNLNYSIEEQLPVKEMGCAAVVSFFSYASHSLVTSVIDGVPVCEIHFSEQECFRFVAEPENNHLDFLETGLIQVEPEAWELINNPSKIGHLENKDEALEITIKTVDK